MQQTPSDVFPISKIVLGHRVSFLNSNKGNCSKTSSRMVRLVKHAGISMSRGSLGAAEGVSSVSFSDSWEGISVSAKTTGASVTVPIDGSDVGEPIGRADGAAVGF